jgi:hypothetical protein
VNGKGMIGMFETWYFMLGILNNLFLISIFMIVRFSKISKLNPVGKAYLLLSVPAIYLIFEALKQEKPIQYVIFLMIFLAFLALDWLYDFALKVSFRKNWKLLLPYLILYWSMNYGFMVMAWKHSAVQGMVILGLFIMQLTTNILSHTKKAENS